jgi:hypothetical protein
MSEDNIWLQGRRREASALDAIITALHHHPHAGGTPEQHEAGPGAPAPPQAICGAGVTARTSQLAARASRGGSGGHGNDRHKAREPGQLAEGRRRPHRRRRPR